jgi:hypothetical protein
MFYRITVISFILITLFGCSGTTLTGYEFETNAVYVAEKSGITMEINAKGYVEPGADIGNGTVKGRITVKNGMEISFRTDSSILTEIVFRNVKKEITDPVNYKISFISCLNEMGFTGFDMAEIEELEKVIKGSEGGPKSTYMEGQTKFLKVEKTEFIRK